MANIVSSLRVWNAFYLVVDSDPSTGLGAPGGVGSLAISANGLVYEKVGLNNTDWALRVTPSIGTDGDFSATLFVAKNGNDVTGDGSLLNPFLTVKKASDTILDATNLKRYAIMVAPGRYSEVGLTLKANVFITGGGAYYTTRIANNAAITLDPDFNVANDCRSGFYNINIATPALDINFATVNSNEGKVYFSNCQLTGGGSFTAFSAINQVSVDNCHVFADLNFIGCNSQVGNNYFEGVGVNYAGLTGLNGSLNMIGNNVGGNVSLNGTIGVNNLTFGNNKLLGLLTVNNAVLASDVSSLPVKSSITLVGTGTISRLNDTFALGYTPATPPNWVAPTPNNTQEAIDRMASLLVTLNTSLPIP